MASASVHKNSSELTFARFRSLENGLEMTWSDGFCSFFHNIWLRDCCYCESCGDSYSSNRFFMPCDIAADCKPATVRIDDSGQLIVNWAGDDHHSVYDPLWLRRNSYDDASRQARFQQPVLWDASLSSNMPRVSFEQARDTDAVRMDLYRKLRDYGFVIVTEAGSEPGFIREVAELIGSLGASAYSEVFDLTPQTSTGRIGNTTRPVPPHTDEAFRHGQPGINMLACVGPADDGGDSILVDGFNLAEILRKNDPQAFEMLSQHDQLFHRIHGVERQKAVDQRTRQRMITLDDRGEVVGIRSLTRNAGPMLLPPDLIEPFYAAHQAFCCLMMSSENQIQYRLQAGETALFDNHRLMHARSDFTDAYRFMQICNVPREAFHERLRMLARELGHHDEADMILCAGAGS